MKKLSWGLLAEIIEDFEAQYPAYLMFRKDEPESEPLNWDDPDVRDELRHLAAMLNDFFF